MRYVKGNIIDAEVDCIVNPVNCKGVMGAGLAKQIANAYPGVLEPYKRVCKEGTLRPGRIQFIRIDRFSGERDPRSTFYVLNLPTKDDWRNPSKIEWIEEALEKIPEALGARGIKSIAFPKLGSGLGGLDWNEVRPLIEKAMSRASEIETIVYGEEATLRTDLESSLKSHQDGEHTGSVLNWSHLRGAFPENSVYIGRNERLWKLSGQIGTPKYGNPFVMPRDGSREDVIAKYDRYIDEKLKEPRFRAEFVTDLLGKDLVCHCAPEACHGHVMRRKLQELYKGTQAARPDASDARGPINSFAGEYAFASNMHPAKVRWGDALTPEREWPNVEIPYVLAKTLDPQARAAGVRLADSSATKGAEAAGKILKKWGKTAPLRPDWEEVKVPLMERLVRDKFTRNPDFAARLKATEGRDLKEGNYWGDTFWGIAQKDIPSKGIKAGEGRNELGRILMDVRSTLDVSPAEHDRSHPMRSTDALKLEMPGPMIGKKSDERTYAGIGSRETPKEVLELMKGIASDLAEKGFILRSGGAWGADDAFEQGCDAKRGRKEIFLPWGNFNGRTSPFTEPSAAAVGLSARFHPAWERLSQGARKLQARNSHQVLGPNLNDKTNVIVCWTENGSIKGGTGQALRMAQHYEIPVVNLGSPRYHSMSRSEIVNEITRKAREKDDDTRHSGKADLDLQA